MKSLFRSLCLVLLGVALGGGATTVAFRCHVVRASDGWHLIQNGTSMPVDCYADIREWTPAEWAEHPRLAAALVAGGKSDLVMRTSARNVFERVIERH